MSKGLEKIVASLELCKQIPGGEFAESALVWARNISPINGRVLLPRVDTRRDVIYQYIICPAPTLAEIWRELRNLSVNVIDGTITVSCRIDPEETLYETARDDNGVTAAALRLWLKLKEIEVKS